MQEINMLNQQLYALKSTLIALCIFTITSCSDGSSSVAPIPPTPPTPPVNTGPTWTNGVFQAESNFKNQCAAPRSGTNPDTGNPYLDVAGSTLHEKHWLRSWSNNTYLWYNEITDIDPATTASVIEYFHVLKTEAITASGTAKDQFHFTQNAANRQQQVSSGATTGYGARFTAIKSSVPREIRVAYTEAGTTATQAPANLLRNVEIIEVDGVDVVTGSSQANIEVLNEGLFPSNPGDNHTFKVRDIDGTERIFSMTASIITSAPVHTTKVITTTGGDKVGYLLFNTFSTSIAEKALFNAFTDFSAQGIDELILDLRYNGGGFLSIAAELGFMIAGVANTSGKNFDKIIFNDKHLTINPVNGQTLTPMPFYSTGRGFSVNSLTTLPSLNLNRVYILSTGRTCSASEAVINGLRGVDVEVVLIGSKTCGKPYGFYATDNCGTVYFTIQFRGENDKGFGDYVDGFTPMNAANPIGKLIIGCEIADDFTSPLGDETGENMLQGAITHLETGLCPASSAQALTLAKEKTISDPNDPTSLYNSEKARLRVFLENNLILNEPQGEQEK